MVSLMINPTADHQYRGYVYAQDFCYRARFSNFTRALRLNQDAVEEIGGTGDILASDKRSKQLGFLLERTGEEKQFIPPLSRNDRARGWKGWEWEVGQKEEGYRGEWEVSKLEEERKVQRRKAKKRLDYWKRLGEPLRRMVERFGSGILVRLLPT